MVVVASVGAEVDVSGETDGMADLVAAGEEVVDDLEEVGAGLEAVEVDTLEVGSGVGVRGREEEREEEAEPHTRDSKLERLSIFVVGRR